MIITCEQCKTRFKVGDDKLAKGPIRVRCSKCNHVFTASSSATPSPAPVAGFGAPSASLPPQPTGAFTAPNNRSGIFRPPASSLPPTAVNPALGSTTQASATSTLPQFPGLSPAPSQPPSAALPSTTVTQRPPVTNPGDPFRGLDPFGRRQTPGLTPVRAPTPDPFAPTPTPSSNPFSAPTAPQTPRAKGDPFGMASTPAPRADPFAGLAENGASRPPTQPPAPSPFGAPARSPTQPPSPFGAPVAPFDGGAPSGFGGSSPPGFGGSSPPGFGPPSSSPQGFGSSPPGFGSSPPGFGTPAPSASPFGAPSPASPFGAPSPAPPFGAPSPAPAPFGNNGDPFGGVAPAPARPADPFDGLGRPPTQDPFAGVGASPPAPASPNPFSLTGEPESDPFASTEPMSASALFGKPSAPSPSSPPFQAEGFDAAAAPPPADGMIQPPPPPPDGADPFSGLDAEPADAQSLFEPPPPPAEARPRPSTPPATLPPAAATQTRINAPTTGADMQKLQRLQASQRAKEIAWAAAQGLLLLVFLVVAVVVGRGGSLEDLARGDLRAALGGPRVGGALGVEDAHVSRRKLPSGVDVVVVTGVVANTTDQKIPAALVNVRFGRGPWRSGWAWSSIDGIDVDGLKDMPDAVALSLRGPRSPSLAPGDRAPFVIVAPAPPEGTKASFAVQAAPARPAGDDAKGGKP